MEVILGLLVELITAALLPMLVATVELVSCVLGLLGELLLAVVMGVAGARAEKRDGEKRDGDERDGASSEPQAATDGVTSKPGESEGVPPLPELPEPRTWSDYRRWFRRLAAGSAVAMAITLCVAVAVQLVWFDGAVRWALARVERESGIAVEFTEAEGSLFTGALLLRQATIVRSDHPLSEFDLTARSVAVDIDMWRLLWRRLRFERVEVDGVAGVYERVGKRAPDAPRKDYEIARLSLRDTKIEVRDATLPLEARTDLMVEQAVVTELRSKFALLDVVLRTEAAGQVYNRPFRAETERVAEAPDQWQAEWTFEKLPVAAVARLGGPFEWLDGGELTMTFRTQWKQWARSLPTECELHFLDVTAHPPDELPMKTRLLAAPVAAWLNSKTEDFAVRFEVEIPRSTFEGQLWLATTDFASQLSGGLTDELLAMATGMGRGRDMLPDRLREALEGAAKEALEEGVDPVDAGKRLLERFRD